MIDLRVDLSEQIHACFVAGAIHYNSKKLPKTAVAHVAAWKQKKLQNLGHVSWVGSVLYR